MKHKPRIAFIRLLMSLLTIAILLSGCWDRLELEDRAVILGVAIDKLEPGMSEDENDVTHLNESNPAKNQDRIRVTVQIALPGRIPLGPGEGGGGKSGSTNPLWIIGVSGHTIDDALMNLQQQVSSRLFFGHLRVIVISEELAKDGIANINDYFRRNPEVRRMAWMMVSSGKAEQIIRAQPPLERVPTVYLISMLDNAVKMGKYPQEFVGRFWSNVSKIGEEGVLPYVKIKKEEVVELAGIAMFNGDRMVGSTKPLEIAAYMGIKGLNPGGYRGVIPFHGTAITIYVTHRTSKVRLRIRDGQPEFNIRIRHEANIEEKTNENVELRNESVLHEIERVDSEWSKRLHESLIAKSQQLGADIFGFGELVRAKQPTYWDRNIRTAERWQIMYKQIPIHVDVKIVIRRVGMKAT